MMKGKADTVAWLETKRDQAIQRAAQFENDALVAQANARTARRDAEVLDHMVEIVRLGS